VFIYRVFGNSIDKIFRDCRGHHKYHFLQMNLGSETCHYIAYGIRSVRKSRDLEISQKIEFLQKIVCFFVFFFLPSSAGSATDLAFSGWISHRSCHGWLDHLPIGESNLCLDLLPSWARHLTVKSSITSKRLT